MTPSELNLWSKISDFQLDIPGIKFTFSDRVARENGWPKDYTKRVIEEYKKFIFLCCVSDQGITPSDPVDQIWHLHLTYTRSYWIDFCQGTIGKQIHHNPTKGGPEEAKKFNEYYTYLKNLYSLHFGSEPPADIWQPNDIRFSDTNFLRVNLKKYLLIKKPTKRFISILTLILIGFFGIVSIQAKGQLLFMILGAVVVAGISYFAGKKKGKKKNGGCSSGCSVSGCSGGHHSGHSGCSGCSGSGCSGCGGGGD
jgi:hypothetical protein